MQPSSALSSSGQMLTERQRFDTDKDRLASQIYTSVRNWFDIFSTRVPNPNIDLDKGTLLFAESDLTTGEIRYFVLDENKLLSKVPSNLDGAINKLRLNKTGYASYNFFLNRLVTDFTGKFESMGEVIKESEQIDDLRNSKVFKTVCLAVVQFKISKVEANKFMLQADKSQWWV